MRPRGHRCHPPISHTAVVTPRIPVCRYTDQLDAVTRETKFFVNGSDITGQLPSMGVQLGGDLQGSERGFLFTVGGGARIGLTGQLFADVSYRYGHVSISDGGVNTNRIQFGIGAHF